MTPAPTPTTTTDPRHVGVAVAECGSQPPAFHSPVVTGNTIVKDARCCGSQGLGADMCLSAPPCWLLAYEVTYSMYEVLVRIRLARLLSCGMYFVRVPLCQTAEFGCTGGSSGPTPGVPLVDGARLRGEPSCTSHHPGCSHYGSLPSPIKLFAVVFTF